MKVFITGGSGFVGVSVVRCLRAAGHDVTALARSTNAASKLKTLGAAVVVGDLQAHGVLRDAAGKADAVLHLAFVYDFAHFQQAAEMDLLAIRSILSGIAGTGKTFVGTNGTLGIQSQPGTIATESTPLADETTLRGPAEMTVRRAEGVRGLVVSLAPIVHGRGDHSFIPELITQARREKVSLYPADGKNVWQAVHCDDAALLFRLALEKGAQGRRYHGVTESAIPMHDIALNIGKRLNIRTESVPVAEAKVRMGWIGHLATLGGPISSESTQAELEWRPTGPTLFRDLRLSYF